MPRGTPTIRPTDAERAEAAWFFALACHSRLKIVRALAAGAMDRQVLIRDHGFHANIGVHINKLEREGLVVTSKDGINRSCALANAKLTKDAIEFSHPSGRKALVPRV
jgi:hypothetical protein